MVDPDADPAFLDSICEAIDTGPYVAAKNIPPSVSDRNKATGRNQMESRIASNGRVPSERRSQGNSSSTPQEIPGSLIDLNC